MRIAFVTPYVPSRVRVRPYYWIKQLAARGHDVRLFSVVCDARDEAALAEMRRWCSVIVTARLPAWRPAWNALRAIGRREPLQLWYVWNRELARHLRRMLAADPPDVAHIEHLRGACFSNALGKVPTVFDAVDSIALLFDQARQAAPGRLMRWASALDAASTERFERTATRRFDRVVVSSPSDASHLGDPDGHDTLAGRISVIPNPVDLDYFSPDGSRIDPMSIVFTGKMSYHANVAAALDLIERIMPLVWRQRPDARLTVVGQDPPPSLRRASGDRVTVTGRVDDLRPYLRRAAVAACPMRYGTGIQNKILEAMACGTPVVASTLACTALSAKHGDELLVAESQEALASAIVRLLDDQALRGRVGSRGRAYVTANHDGEVLIKRLEGLYAELV